MKKLISFIIIVLFIILIGIGLKFASDSFMKEKAKEEKVESSVMEMVEKEEKKVEEKVEDKKEEKEEKKEEEKKEEVKKEEVKEEKNEYDTLLDKAQREGKYWAMVGFKVEEKQDSYLVTGSVYDAKRYTEWVDEIGSGGLPEGESPNGRDGLMAEGLSFLLPKDLVVGVEPIEGFELEARSVEEFLAGEFGTFLFENEGDKIVEILDWFMNYSG